MKLTSVYIVDDHDLMKEGLQRMVESFKNLEFIGSSSNGNHAYDQILILNPEIILLDIDLVGLNGLLVLERLRKVDFSGLILMISQHQEQNIIDQAKKLGANGYLIKSSSYEEFDSAVNKIMSGGSHFQNSRDLIQEVKKVNLSNDIANIVSSISNREREIIQLITEGYSNKEIGEKLFISHRTVDTHRTNIMRKLNANNVASLVSLAYKYGLVE